MWPSSKVEFEWKEPKAATSAIQSAVDRYRGKYWRIRTTIAGCLLLAYLCLFPYWINGFLPLALRSKESQGQIERAPYALAIVGFIGFALVFSPPWLRIHFPGRIRILRDKLESTSGHDSISYDRIRSCTIHDFDEFRIIEVESNQGILKLYGCPANLDLNRLPDFLDRHGIQTIITPREAPTNHFHAAVEMDRLISKQKNGQRKLKKPSKEVNQPKPNFSDHMFGILIIAALFGACIRAKSMGDRLYSKIVIGERTMKALGDSAQEARVMAGNDWPRIRSINERRMVLQSNAIESSVKEYSLLLPPMFALALSTYFVTPLILIRIFWRTSSTNEMRDPPKQENTDHEKRIASS